MEWHDKSKADPKLLSERFEKIRDANRLRVDIDRFHCSLYYDRAYQGFVDGRSLPELLDEALGSSRLNENVILRIVSTLSAKFARQRSAPAVLTDMGDWALQRRADRYGRFLKGVLSDTKVYEKQRAADLHDIICGTGFIHVYSRKGKVKTEVVPPWELFVDTADGRRGDPQTLYRRQIIPRERLARLYPKKKVLIENAKSTDTSDAFDVFGTYDADVVELVTGWHLPTDDDSDDGMVAVTVNGEVLDEGEWSRPRFPFAASRYMLPPDGFWGIGVVQQLVGMQVELNRTLQQRQTSLMTLSAPFVLMERGSQIIKSHFSNIIGRIVEFTGTKPEIVMPGAINPEQFNHGDRVKSSMFQNSGVSELAASSMKPAGLNSGKAIRTYADMMDDTLHDAMQRRDQQILDLSEIILDEIESIAEEDGTYHTKYVGPYGIEKISYSEISIDRDAMVMKVQSSSALSTSVSGRIQDVTDLKDLGVEISASELETLLNIPDLSESSERRNSMPNLLREVLEVEILDHGKYMVPEPRWDIELALDLVSEVILMAQLRKAPKERIELLRKFELECMATAAKTKPPELPPPAPMPDGTGMPPETDPSGGVPLPAPSPIDAGGMAPIGP